ncbi:MAG: ATP-binding cassette domain-containing protein [Alphaproteobacteria bacterium]|nr:ATP-binding cassette domain-containing protein [Alphaproteobacteria bacterium]
MENVVAGYDTAVILDRVNLFVRRGSITTITGPYGAGKSAILQAAFGLLPVRHGRVVFDGTEMTNATPRRLLAAGMCFVPQGRGIVPGLTVRQNVELGAAAARSRANLAGRIGAALAQYPVLLAKADERAGALAVGEQKLLEIARCLMIEPKLVLIDEPSAGLPPDAAKDVLAALTGLRGRGVTVLVAEQNAKSLLGVSDDAIVVELGRVRHSDRAASLMVDPRIGQLFLGGAMGATAPLASSEGWIEKKE